MGLLLKQMWRLLRIAGSGPGSMISLGLLAIVITCQLLGIRVTIRMVQWSADFYNALQKLDVPAVTTQVGVFALLVAAAASLYLIGRLTRKTLQIRWRRRMTEELLDRWTATKAYWLLHPSLNASVAIDNPDQRIAEDPNIFLSLVLGTEDGVRSGALDFVMSFVGLVSYVILLWELSTFALPLALFGYEFEIPRYMIWFAPIYVALATLFTHLLGHQMPRLLAEEQKREADFRFALTHVRENAGSIALLNGERTEQRILSDRFDGVASIWHQVIRREFIYGLFVRPYFMSVLRIPAFLALPAFLAGKVTLGGLMQLAAAFQNVVTTLSWLVFNYKLASDIAATTRRLHSFLDAIDSISTAPSGIARTVSSRNALRISDLVVATPDGRELLTIPELAVEPGQSVWLRGDSGLGKSTLIRAIAGIWRHGAGTIEVPNSKLLFLPQHVYLPLLALEASALYPAHEAGAIDSPALLRDVGLGHRLQGDVASSLGLSGGEQQRLTLARVLAAQPDWLFLDEAASALDAAAERSLMEKLRTALPNTTFIIVSHREPQGFEGLRTVVLQELQSGPSEVRDLGARNPIAVAR